MSRAADRIRARSFAARVDNARSAVPTLGGRGLHARYLDAYVPDIAALPVIATDTEIQDTSTGDFYWMIDYSAIGGGDVLK